MLNQPHLSDHNLQDEALQEFDSPAILREVVDEEAVRPQLASMFKRYGGVHLSTASNACRTVDRKFVTMQCITGSINPSGGAAAEDGHTLRHFCISAAFRAGQPQSQLIAFHCRAVPLRYHVVPFRLKVFNPLGHSLNACGHHLEPYHAFREKLLGTKLSLGKSLLIEQFGS